MVRHYSVDRIEGGTAVLVSDSGTIRKVNISLLPGDACEGAVLKKHGRVYILDKTCEEQKRNKAYDLLNKIIEN